MKVLKSAIQLQLAEMIKEILINEDIFCEIVPTTRFWTENAIFGQGALYDLIVEDKNFEKAIDVIKSCNESFDQEEFEE